MVTTTYQDELLPSTMQSFSEQQAEIVYVPSQISPTAQTVFSPAASMTMVADAEQVALTRQLQLEGKMVSRFLIGVQILNWDSFTCVYWQTD